MKRIYASLVLFFILSPLQGNAKDMDNIYSLEKGTLVIAVPSSEGLVVCADKSVYYFKENITRDEKIKIVQLDKYGLFSSVGILSFTRNTGSNHDSFEVDRLVKNYFENKDIRTFTNERWKDFCQYLENFFRADTFTQIESDDLNKPFLQVAFFYLDLTKSINRTVVQLFIKKAETTAPSRLDIQITFKTDPDYIVRNSIKILGEAAVINEVRTGTDSRFDDIRKNPLLLKAFTTQAISSVEAKYVASYLIKITSDRSNLIPGFKGHVSRTCDCAILDVKDGFKWIDN